MTEETAKFWNLAGAAGLALAGVSIGFDVAGQLLPATSGSFVGAMLVTLVSVALTVAKIVAIFWLLRRFATKYVESCEEVNQSKVFRFSLATCALSSLVVAGAMLLVFNYLVPADYIATLTETLNEALMAGGEMSEEQIATAMDEVTAALPSMMFWATIIRCMFWGLIFSLIIRRRVFPSNPFKEIDE